jgi:hypothetical protein
MDGKIKAPPPAGRMSLVGLDIFGIWRTRPAGASTRSANDINARSAIYWISEGASIRDQAGR